MNDLEETGSRDLVPYERGLPPSDVLKGSLARFLPGSVLGLAGLLGAFGWPGDLWANLPGYLGLVGIATVGFGLGLEAMRRWLYPDANVDGGRSFVAGLMTGAIWFSLLTLLPALQGPQAWLVFPLIGTVLAVLMFFAWLTPTPEEMRKETGPAVKGGRDPALPRR
jgi:hypothetical protein